MKLSSIFNVDQSNKILDGIDSAVNTTTGGIVSTILAFTLPQHGNTELTSVAILSAAGCFSVAAIDRWKEIRKEREQENKQVIPAPDPETFHPDI